MRIDKPGGGHITIPDDDPRAIRIMEGSKVEFKDGKMIIGREILTLEQQVDQAKSVEDLKRIIKQLIKK